MTRTPMLAVGCALALAFAASAAQAQTSTPMSAQSGQKASKADQMFMKKAMEGDMAEVQMGKLAQQNGQSQDVKQLGQTLEQDHSQNLDQAKSVAQSMNVQAPSGPNTEQKAVYNRLSKLKGAAFDRQFAAATIKDHRKDIAEFNKEGKKSGAAGQFAQQTLPALKKHLQMAEQISGKSGTTGSGSHMRKRRSRSFF